jgi:hypothetical protein
LELPSDHGFAVVAPASGNGTARTYAKAFTFDSKTLLFRPLCKHLGEETGRPRWDDTVLVSKVYPGAIHDQHSFETWLKWKEGRAAEDCFLWVLA